MYGVRWDPNRRAEIVNQAEQRALVPGLTWGHGFMYRFEDHTYAERIDPYEDWDDNWRSVTHIELTAYLVCNKTAQGYNIWVYDSGYRRRFINSNWTKRFALPTVEQALESYIARKDRQARIYEARASKARRCIEEAKYEGYTVEGLTQNK